MRNTAEEDLNENLIVNADLSEENNSKQRLTGKKKKKKVKKLKKDDTAERLKEDSLEAQA